MSTPDALIQPGPETRPARPDRTTGSARPRVRRLAGQRLALAAVVLVGIAFATVIQSFSWNQTSHYDLIRSLDQDGTHIDAYQSNTGDKVMYKGHYYSARAPGLALYALPWYNALGDLNAEAWARSSKAQQGDDEMIYLVGLWGNVLPGLLLLVLVWRVAERFEPRHGAAAAVLLGLGTLVLPLSTLLFSHVFTAMLGFAAFALMLRERDGPPSPSLLGVAGLLIGYAVGAEYPLFFVGLVLGLYLLSRPGALTPLLVIRRAGAYVVGGLIGIIPLLLYNHYAFHSWTHLAYSDVPRQQSGFFGISAPSLKILAALLLDSRGLLTFSPILIMGAVGIVLMYRRGHRAEALTSVGICLCYVGYNSGYYLPFGGGFMGPRFLTTMLPFLAVPLALAIKRFPGPSVALGAASCFIIVLASLTHPLIGYENETVVFVRLLKAGNFQPSILSAYGVGRGWEAIYPFLILVFAAIGCAAYATDRLNLNLRALLAGIGALVAWALFAAYIPTALGIDHVGLLAIQGAGDKTALYKPFPHTDPIRTLVLYASVAALLTLGLARLLRHQRQPQVDRARAARAGSRVMAS